MTNDVWRAADGRYDAASCRRCGASGVRLPAVSLGLWHNFGGADVFDNMRAMARAAFDCGVFHFDLANNYGPPPGSAEENFGRVLKRDLAPYRDELIVSSKAGYLMWPGPFGEWGSRKYLVASCDRSLQRLGLDYVDIFYHHRPDPETPLEESMGALDYIVRSGRALYAGISNYPPERAAEAFAILRRLGTPCLIHQPFYSMLARDNEQSGLFGLLEREQVGAIVFSPLAQGLLSDKYLHGIPAASRAARGGFLKPSRVTPELVAKLVKLNAIAAERGQSLAQMAIGWVLRLPAVTSALIGASTPEQIRELAGKAPNCDFAPEELARIEAVLNE